MLDQLNERIITCERCPRLRNHCRKVAQLKRASFRDQAYWARPVPNFIPLAGPAGGSSAAGRPVGVPADIRLLIVGLAPAAHGANRTGRMFTGDRSGDFLFRVLVEVGFATGPAAASGDDGLRLIDAVITAAVHCAPPGNKPTRAELDECSRYLDPTLEAVANLRVIVCLGRIAHDAVLRLYQRRGWIQQRSRYRFAHGAAFFTRSTGVGPGRPQGPVALLCSYHPSQQNTFTGRLTAPMMRSVFRAARRLAVREHV